MAREYNTDKFKPGETKFTCPGKAEGDPAVIRVFIGQDQTSRKLKFQVFNTEKNRGFGRPTCVDEIPSTWRKAA